MQNAGTMGKIQTKKSTFENNYENFSNELQGNEIMTWCFFRHFIPKQL